MATLKYLPYHKLVYAPATGTDDQKEEGLANADSFLRLRELSVGVLKTALRALGDFRVNNLPDLLRSGLLQTTRLIPLRMPSILPATEVHVHGLRWVVAHTEDMGWQTLARLPGADGTNLILEKYGK